MPPNLSHAYLSTKEFYIRQCFALKPLYYSCTYVSLIYLQVTFTAGPGDNGCELRCEATNSAVSKPVSETITIELLPETTSTSTESVTKVEKDVVPVQIVKNSIEENTDSTETGSNTPKDDYAYYDDDQYDYYTMNNIKESDPYAHPEDISTNILTGIILKKTWDIAGAYLAPAIFSYSNKMAKNCGS